MSDWYNVDIVVCSCAVWMFTAAIFQSMQRIRNALQLQTMKLRAAAATDWVRSILAVHEHNQARQTTDNVHDIAQISCSSNHLYNIQHWTSICATVAISVLLSLALVLGLEVSSRTNFESLALALSKSPWAWSIRSLALLCAAISQTNTLTVLKHFHRN